MSQLILSDPTCHNWWRKLQTVADAGSGESELRQMIIRHDVGCGTPALEPQAVTCGASVWHDGDCDCDPDIEIDRTAYST